MWRQLIKILGAAAEQGHDHSRAPEVLEEWIREVLVSSRGDHPIHADFTMNDAATVAEIRQTMSGSGDDPWEVVRSLRVGSAAGSPP